LYFKADNLESLTHILLSMVWSKILTDTDPVVQHLSGHVPKGSWGESPLAAGSVFSRRPNMKA
jgi:hypothetical protein